MVPGLLMLGVDTVAVEVVAVCAPAIISGVRCYRESGKKIIGWGVWKSSTLAVSLEEFRDVIYCFISSVQKVLLCVVILMI